MRGTSTFFKLSLLCLAPLLFLALVPALRTFNPFAYAREDARRKSCLSNLRQLGLGIRAYSADNDARLPLAVVLGVKVGPTPIIGRCPPSPVDNVGWSDALIPYTKSINILSCPADIHGPPCDSRLAGYTDYWMNKNVSGMKVAHIRARQSTVMVGDGDGGSQDSNATYNLSSIPNSLPGSDPPPWFRRHMSGANYLFVDGHADWLRPDNISNEPGKLYTFSTR